MKISFELMGLSLLGLYSYYKENMTEEEQLVFNTVMVNNFRKHGWNGADFMKELAAKDLHPKKKEDDLDKLKRIVWESVEAASTNPLGL